MTSLQEEEDDIFEEDSLPAKSVKLDYSTELGPVQEFLVAASKLFTAEIPTIDEVEEALKSPPPLPISQTTMSLLLKSSRATAALVSSVVVKDSDAFPACSDFLWLPIDQVFHTLAGEDMYHTVLDWSLSAVWPRATLVRPVKTGEQMQNRNTSSKTSTPANDGKYTLAVSGEPKKKAPKELTTQGQVRPDMFILYNGTESFLIEAKAYKGEPIDIALDELSEKHAPNGVLLGDAPFIPGVAFKLPYVQFALIVPDSATAFTTFKTMKVGAKLDMNSNLDRVRLVAGMGVFYELWLKLIGLWPKKRYGYDEVFPGTTVVRVARDQLDAKGKELIYIQKMVDRKEMKHIHWGDVIALYGVAHEIPFLVRAHSPKAPPQGAMAHALSLYPVGHSRAPRDLVELKAMIKCVLQSLQAMHKLNFVHRDVRPPNVVRLFDGSWWLIDLERARKCDSLTLESPWPENFNHEFLPDLRGDEDDTQKHWCPVHDVWQLAKSVSVIASEMKEEEKQQGGNALAKTIWQACWQNEPTEFDLEKAPVGSRDANAAARALSAIEIVELEHE